MKTIIICAAACAIVAGAASAAEYKAVEPHACRPTVEKWLETHGRKVEQTNAVLGALSERVIRWDSGVLVVATIGPAGSRGICVLASRFLGRDDTVAAVE